MKKPTCFLPNIWFCTACLTILATGCSPKMYVNIEKSYPPRPADAPVVVYGLAETPPPGDVMGSLLVEHSGTPGESGSGRIMRSFATESNKHGGNGFHLILQDETGKPGSTAYRMQGEVLRLPDSTYTALLTEHEQGRLVSPRAPKTTTSPAPAREANAFRFNAGYGFIVSETQLAPGVTGNPGRGFELNVGYEWVAPCGLGFGIGYSGYFASATYRAIPLYFQLHYVAPEFVMRQAAGTKWLFREAVGIGYANYSERGGGASYGIRGFGFHVSAGFEYLLSPNIGLGADINAYAARFPSADRYLDSNKKSGITRISLTAGVRFHF